MLHAEVNVRLPMESRQRVRTTRARVRRRLGLAIGQAGIAFMLLTGCGHDTPSTNPFMKKNQVTATTTTTTEAAPLQSGQQEAPHGIFGNAQPQPFGIAPTKTADTSSSQSNGIYAEVAPTNEETANQPAAANEPAPPSSSLEYNGPTGPHQIPSGAPIEMRPGESVEFGYTFAKPGHGGLDISLVDVNGQNYTQTTHGRSVISPMDGTVVQINQDVNYVGGKYVIICNDDAVQRKVDPPADPHCVYMGHQSEIDVSPGQVVHFAQKVGIVGETGNADGEHIHYQEWDGVPDDNGYMPLEDLRDPGNFNPTERINN